MKCHEVFGLVFGHNIKRDDGGQTVSDTLDPDALSNAPIFLVKLVQGAGWLRRNLQKS